MTNVIVVSYRKYTMYYILVINVTIDGYWEAKKTAVLIAL